MYRAREEDRNEICEKEVTFGICFVTLRSFFFSNVRCHLVAVVIIFFVRMERC